MEKGEELELEDIHFEQKAYAILSPIVSLATIEPCRKSKVLTTFAFYYRIMCNVYETMCRNTSVAAKTQES